MSSMSQTAADQKTRQIQLLKARVSGTITQRRAALGQELRELQAFLTVEAPGDVQSQQEREKRMEQFKLKMTAYKSQESDLNRLNAMSDQEFAVWLEDQRNRTRQDTGQPATSYQQIGGTQRGPSSQTPQPPVSMMPNVTNHQSPARINPQLAARAQSLRLSQISPNMQPQLSVQLPVGIQPGTRPFAWPTMSVNMFRRAHNTYCQRNNIIVDQSMLQFEGWPIDLHALHTEVLGHGGSARVSQNELWPVVAAKLGFTQFQGSDIEPARSGPAGAQHFRNIYQRFLEGFDNLFLFSIFSLVQMQPRGDGGGQPDTASVGQQSATDHSMMSAGMPSTDPVPISVQWNNASGSGEMNLTVPPGRSNANQTNGLSAHAQFGQPHQTLRQAQPYPPQPQQPQPAHLITKPSVAVVNGQSPTAEEMRQVSQWLEAIRQIFMHTRTVRGLTFVEVADHEKAEWHTLYKEVLDFLSTNLNLKMPILALSQPEDVARSMTLGVLTCFQQRSYLGRKDQQDQYMFSLASMRQLRDSWRMWSAMYNKYALERRQANGQSASASPPQIDGTDQGSQNVDYEILSEALEGLQVGLE